MASLRGEFWLKKIFASAACASQGGLGIKKRPLLHKVIHSGIYAKNCVPRGTDIGSMCFTWNILRW